MFSLVGTHIFLCPAFLPSRCCHQHNLHYCVLLNTLFRSHSGSPAKPATCPDRGATTTRPTRAGDTGGGEAPRDKAGRGGEKHNLESPIRPARKPAKIRQHRQPRQKSQGGKGGGALRGRNRAKQASRETTKITGPRRPPRLGGNHGTTERKRVRPDSGRI